MRFCINSTIYQLVNDKWGHHNLLNYPVLLGFHFPSVLWYSTRASFPHLPSIFSLFIWEAKQRSHKRVHNMTSHVLTVYCTLMVIFVFRTSIIMKVNLRELQQWWKRLINTIIWYILRLLLVYIKLMNCTVSSTLWVVTGL